LSRTPPANAAISGSRRGRRRSGETPLQSRHPLLSAVGLFCWRTRFSSQHCRM